MLQQQAPRIFTPPPRQPTTSSTPHGGEFWALSCPALPRAVSQMVCCTCLRARLGECRSGKGRGKPAQQINNIVSAHPITALGQCSPVLRPLSAFVIARLDKALARRVALGRRSLIPPCMPPLSAIFLVQPVSPPWCWGGKRIGTRSGTYMYGVIRLRWLAPSHIPSSASRVIRTSLVILRAAFSVGGVGSPQL